MKLNVATFKYVKEGKLTPRKLLVLSKPTDTFFGIEYEDEGEIINYVDYLKEKETFESYLKEKYNLSGANYKRFKVDKIKQLTEEKVEI